jgi:calcineurin-like phosphoesterase family protein
LWSDFRLHGKGLAEHRKDVARRMVNDYQRIRATKANRLLRPDDTQRWHLESVKWLKKCIDAPFDGATIVVTHMAPSVQSISPGFATDPLSAAYASRLDDLVEQVDLWVHGHTHQSLDYRLGKARVVCNPLGYSGSFQVSRAENVDFDPNFVVEIP